MNNILIKNCLLNNLPSDIEIIDGIINKIDKDIINNSIENIDANFNHIFPGLIDIHIQGAAGYDFLDSDLIGLNNLSLLLAKLGVTSVLATTVYKADHKNEHIGFTNNYIGKNKLPGCELLGYHFEGPFINPDKIGGLNPDSVSPFSEILLNQIISETKGKLKILTLAPEIDLLQNYLEKIINSGIIPAIGHSNLDYNLAEKMFNSGLNHITHIFNAIPSIHHRNPGPITAAFLNNSVTAQIISDGVHLHPAIVKLIHHNIGTDRCICITDGMQGLGLPDGEYYYNGKKYLSVNGTAKYENGTLIGCTLGLLDIVKRFSDFTDLPFHQSILTATNNPARLLNINKGNVAVGYDADLILLDKDFILKNTIINGKVIV